MKSRMSNKHKTSKKTTPQSCVIAVSVRNCDGQRNCLALVDTGSSATLANEAIVANCTKNETKNETKNDVEWSTQGGAFKTTRTATVQDIKLPQFTRNRSVEHKMHLFKKK